MLMRNWTLQRRRVRREHGARELARRRGARPPRARRRRPSETTLTWPSTWTSRRAEAISGRTRYSSRKMTMPTETAIADLRRDARPEPRERSDRVAGKLVRRVVQHGREPVTIVQSQVQCWWHRGRRARAVAGVQRRSRRGARGSRDTRGPAAHDRRDRRRRRRDRAPARSALDAPRGPHPASASRPSSRRCSPGRSAWLERLGHPPVVRDDDRLRHRPARLLRRRLPLRLTARVAPQRASRKDLPTLVQQAEHGQGWVGRLINRLHLHNWVVKNLAPKLSQYAGQPREPRACSSAPPRSARSSSSSPSPCSRSSCCSTSRRSGRARSRSSPSRAGAASRASPTRPPSGSPATWRATSLTSIIAGLVVWVSMLALRRALRRPARAVGGARRPPADRRRASSPSCRPTSLAFIHSPSAGIGVAVIFVVYWQVENHVLNPIVMSRTVKMSKLADPHDRPGRRHARRAARRGVRHVRRGARRHPGRQRDPGDRSRGATRRRAN